MKKEMMLNMAMKARAEMKASDDRRDAGLPVSPGDIVRYDHIPYGPDGTWQILDVYRPARAGDAALPVIVNVHGGGWIYGTKETYQFYCMDLARRGFAVVNFTYRLAPETPFPGSLEDTCRVFGWVLENAEKYGFDKENVFAVGDSAGGHLLALFCELCSDPEFAGGWDFAAPVGFVPRAVALNCGSYHHERAAGSRDLLLAVMPQVTDKSVEAVDATRHVTADFPPTFLMTCNDDFLKDDALRMARSLMDASVPFALRFYGGKGTQLGHVFHCNTRLPEAGACNDDECAFFRAYLREGLK